MVVTVDPAGAVYSRYPAGSEVTLPRIAGHRDADSTDCPGDALYGELPRHPVPARTPSPATPVQATITTLGGERACCGTLTLLDGTPLAGQPVTIQSRSVSRRGEVVAETPVAQVLTNAEGQWTLPGGAARHAPDSGCGRSSPARAPTGPRSPKRSPRAWRQRWPPAAGAA